MKTMRHVAITLLVMLSITAPCWARWGAIAYSVSTGRYGTSWNCHSEQEAKAMALSKCRVSDAYVRVFVENGWAALAVGGPKGWGVGWSHTSRGDAERIALQKCGSGSRIKCWIASGGGGG